jgi:hypothetical protein
LGNAPTMGSYVFSSAVNGFTVQYYNGSTGFTSPTWLGYPSVNLGNPPLKIAVEQPIGTNLSDGGASDFAGFAVDAPTWTEVILSPRVKVRVTTDYMTSQGIRVPLWPSTAQRVADRFDAILPTKTLVDAIWRAATVKVSPHSMTPRPDAPRDSNRLLAEHEAIVDAQVAGRAGLVAGNKKDLIVGRTAAAHPDRVTIFGWHRLDGSVIQDPSWVHNARYGADYAHGTRLVSRTAFVDGRPVPIEQVFADPSLAPLVNESGTLTPAQLAYPRS